MSEKRNLHLNSVHFKARPYEREAPVKRFEVFDPSYWKLLIAKVRTDTCKFVSTAWEVYVDGEASFSADVDLENKTVDFV